MERKREERRRRRRYQDWFQLRHSVVCRSRDE